MDLTGWQDIVLGLGKMAVNFGLGTIGVVTLFTICEISYKLFNKYLDKKIREKKGVPVEWK